MDTKAPALSPQHEALHRIFRADKELFARTMSRVFQQNVPVPSDVSILDTDFTEARPHLRRGDSVLLAHFLVEDSKKKYVIVVEAQRKRDDDKLRAWPYYVSYLHDKYQCDVALLIVCSTRAAARWARKPITIGLPGVTAMTLITRVVGPDNLGPVTDLGRTVDDVGLAVLAAITNSRSRLIGDILKVLAEALSTIDQDTAEIFADLTMSGLHDTKGQPIWRKLMKTSTFPYASSLREMFREEFLEEGRVLEARDAVRDIIEARGFQLSGAHAKLIVDCADLGTLKAWARAAVTAATVDEIFR